MMHSLCFTSLSKWWKRKKKKRSVVHVLVVHLVAHHRQAVRQAVIHRDLHVPPAVLVHLARLRLVVRETRERARADRGGGDRPSRRSPSPRRRRVSPSPKRRTDRSTSRGRRRSPRRSPRRASPRRSPKRSPRRSSPRKASPSKRISIRNLSRNVTKEHLAEIFGMYGPIKSCDLPPERFYTHLHRGYGYVEYENAEDAEKALKYFDGGQIDGQVVSVELTLNRATSRRSPARKSPVRRRYSISIVLEEDVRRLAAVQMQT
ncbi:unnamed protein product [Cylicostephanus goldi]|uniref:RRM domain-containing protein n=1 Tax=Cylicostephanus goldi TaxID=71465 RepID=A0A3P7MEW4_CYLGO|nr:unnamed protein product [Cylicostephanus goldi]